LRSRCQSRSYSRKEWEVFGWSRSWFLNNARSWIRCRTRTFCPTPFSEIQLNHFYITLLSWEFLLKWYNFFWYYYWNREFLLCTTISIDCLLLQNYWQPNVSRVSLRNRSQESGSDSEILERSMLESDILPPTWSRTVYLRHCYEGERAIFNMIFSRSWR